MKLDIPSLEITVLSDYKWSSAKRHLSKVPRNDGTGLFDIRPVTDEEVFEEYKKRGGAWEKGGKIHNVVGTTEGEVKKLRKEATERQARKSIR